MAALLAALLAALVCAAGAARPAQACSCYVEIDVWPPDGTVLPRNPQIVVETLHPDFFSVANQAPRLRSEHDVVPLVLVAESSGPQMDGKQFVLAPERRLRPRTSYTLEIESEYFVPVRRQWTTSSKLDRTPPEWFSPPQPRGFWRNQDLCTDAKNYLVDIPVVDDNSPVLLWASLRRTDGDGEWSTGLVEMTSFQISIGSRTCTPGIWLEPGPIYELRLVPFDLAGNRGLASDSITFGIPAEPTLSRQQVDILAETRARRYGHLRTCSRPAPRSWHDLSRWRLAGVGVGLVACLLVIVIRRSRRRSSARARMGRWFSPDRR